MQLEPLILQIVETFQEQRQKPTLGLIVELLEKLYNTPKDMTIRTIFQLVERKILKLEYSHKHRDYIIKLVEKRDY